MTCEAFLKLQTSHTMEPFIDAHLPLVHRCEHLPIIENQLNLCGRLLRRNGVV